MRIKKTKNNNEYVSAGGIWVRDFTKENIPHVCISPMVEKKDYQKLLLNEDINRHHNYTNVAEEKISVENVVIVSDGYEFDQKHLMLKDLPTNVYVFGVNRVIPKWKLMDLSLEQKRAINLYIVNNPYAECLRYLPQSDMPYYPSCVASTRTNNDFINKYKGRLYFYEPTPENTFGRAVRQKYYIDDYRNPVCAAIDLAFHSGAKKIMLLCCDGSFEGKREGATQLENGLYSYREHLILQEIVDAKAFWLNRFKTRKIKVADHSSGGKYNNIPYINSQQEIVDFFTRSSEEA